MKLFRTGRLVEATVIEQRPMGVVVEVGVSQGPNLSYVHDLGAPLGARVPAIVGDLTSSLVLVVPARGKVMRASLLTREQLGQVAGG